MIRMEPNRAEAEKSRLTKPEITPIIMNHIVAEYLHGDTKSPRR